MKKYLDRVFWGNSLHLLKALPDASIDACIADPMYGILKNANKSNTYEWGVDPIRGDPIQWWEYHRPFYEQVRRVLRPGGALAWAQGCKFSTHFRGWFGDHRLWPFSRYLMSGRNAFGHIWIVQNREQQGIRFPDKDGLIICCSRPKWLKKAHPCAKALNEMVFMVENLTAPGEIVLDCFSGSGTTLVAAKKLGRRFIGCDRSKLYCQVAMKWLASV